MQFLNLPSGDRLPAVGLGFWKVEKDRAPALVVEAIRRGYRHFDCACDYGNECQAGAGFTQALGQGLCRREQLWVTSKLWNTYHARAHVRPALERSLADLGLDYLDLYLVHFPIAQKFVPFETRYPPEWTFDPHASRPRMEFSGVPYAETWQAMEELVDAGLARNIGVCNIGCSQLRDLLTTCRIRPAVLQVELHPYLAQERLLRFCQDERIAVTAFSPLGAESYLSIGMARTEERVLQHPAVEEIAARLRKTPAQVLLRWGVQRGAAVVPRTWRCLTSS
jgi:D-xylose reductase